MINIDQHPEFLCHVIAQVNVENKEKEDIELSAYDIKKNTFLIPLPSKALNARTYTSCGRVPYITSEPTPSSVAVNQTVNSLIISIDGIVSSPEDSADKNGSRLIGADRPKADVFKVEYLN